MKRMTALIALSSVIATSSVASVSDAAPLERRYSDVATCVEGGPRPCVVSALRNGEPLGEGYRVVGSYHPAISSEHSATVMVSAFYGQDFDLGFASLSDTWTITVDVGGIEPRTVHGRSTDTGVVKRPGDGAEGGNLVTVTGHPVTISGQCDLGTMSCPEWADSPTSDNKQWDGAFDVSITDFASMPQEEQGAYDGLTYFSNVAIGIVPPSMRVDEATGENYMYIALANRHYLQDGVTVFKGAVDISIPDRFLRQKFGIPDPETMTDTSLLTTVGGAEGGRGRVTVRRSPAGDAMQIEIRDVTFSKRDTKITLGTVRPTAPKSLRVRSLRGGRAKLVFAPSTARGAKIASYTGRCLTASGPRVQSTTRFSGDLTLTGFKLGRGYNCRVRANSALGSGGWSPPSRVRM